MRKNGTGRKGLTAVLLAGAVLYAAMPQSAAAAVPPAPVLSPGVFGAVAACVRTAPQLSAREADAHTPDGGDDIGGNASERPALRGKTQAQAAAKTPPQETEEAPQAPALSERTYSPEEEETIAAFYANTVLAGDSVLLGFRNYCRSGDEVMKGLQFLAAGSLSLHNAFWPVSSKSVHPIWQGEQRPVWESVQMIGADRVFLFFGINDMAYGVEESTAKYGEFIATILAYRPEARIYIISATYMLEGTEQKNLNNENIALFNERMAAEAAANGWGFVDMATPTSDGRGNLLPAYCTDGFLHQTRSAYQVWERVLKDYALTESGGAPQEKGEGN